ncbi:tyrosine-type recombinase/integrase [Sneathiella chinensis]|uniref:Integrase n=2 Tax=Alphaproteobacteria TaxID=28211 RepID=A0ABQ5U8S3_9PROT|nr:site-specific integrase [Sneathiella chinensis]GLQ08068.1 integrase [Sneathiella chinensis]
MVAPNEKINFTKAALTALPLPPEGKRYSFKDSRVPGLIIRVMPSGLKSFQLYQKLQGRPIRVTLGKFPDMTIEKARNAATQAKGELASGTNPNVEKNRLRKEITLKELFDLYMDRYSKVEKKSWRYDEREINKFLSHWFNRKISSISKYDIKTLHLKTKERNGLYQANRILERIRSMYNKAIEWGWNGDNPTNGIKKFREEARDRYAQPNELPLLFAALDEELNEVARDYLYVSLYTGARKTNVLQMRWEQIDWHNRTWRIPETKNGDPVIVPLSIPAEQLLESRLKASQGSPWVFPSDKSKAGHLNDPKKAWTRIRQRATLALWKQDDILLPLISKVQEGRDPDEDIGQVFKAIEQAAKDKDIRLPTGLMDIRIHDIRRTFGSYQAITGASEAIIGKSLGHKSSQATRVYARLHNDPVRASIDKATEAMLQFKK